MTYYQLTFEDIENAKRISLEPGRTAFLDESGCFGFDFDSQGVTPYYIVCAVIVKNKNITSIEKRIDEIRNSLFGGSEMKSSKIANNHKRRSIVLMELLNLDFNLILLIANKKLFIENSPLKEYKKSFIKFLHQKLYEAMYSTYPKLKIIEDEHGNTEFQRGFKDYVIKHRSEYNLFDEYDFGFVNSKNSNIVQIADIIAGSVMQNYLDDEAPNVLNIFKGKIVEIVNFPPAYQIYSPDNNSDNKYDSAVYNLAVKCANDYIERHKKEKNIEINLRVHFLRYILFKARMYEDSSYIYADKIIKVLRDISDINVKKDYLYRRIIAPLRDEGIIIASSSHGYKIPKSLSDISAYINQTVTVVGPMLSRIEKCRKQILKFTDSELDILNDHSLANYRRYFGDFD